jgi:integrase/recombinase XerD
VVAGPLAPFAPGFRVELAERGYAPRSAVDLLHVMAQLSRWLDEQHLDPGGLTGEAIDRFVVDRREKYCKRLWESGFERLLTSLYYIPRS